MKLRNKLIFYFLIIILSFSISFFLIIEILFVQDTVNKTKKMIKIQNDSYVKVFNKKLNFIRLFIYNSSKNSIFWEQLNYNDPMIKKMSTNALEEIYKKYDKLITDIVLVNKEKTILNSIGDSHVKNQLKTYLPNLNLNESIFFKDYIFRDSKRNYQIIFSNPIKKYGTLDGALIFVFNLNELFSELVINETQHLNVVFDSSGQILYHRNNNLILNNIKYFTSLEEENIYKYRSKEDKIMIGSVNKLNNNWNLLSLTNKDFIYSSVNKTVYTTLLFLIITIIIGTYSAYRFSTNTTKPILKLLKFIRRIIKYNDYSINIKSDRKDEIGMLYEGFNQLVENINFHIEVEKIINNISKYFIFSSTEMSNAILKSFKMLGKYFNYNRINLLIKNRDNIYLNKYKWINKKNSRDIPLIDKIFLKKDSKFLDKIKKSDVISKCYFNNLPDEIKKELLKNYENNPPKSLLISRLYYKNSVNGLIIVEIYDKNRLWNKEEKTVFSTLSEIIINSIKRREAEKNLKELNEKLELKVEERTEELNRTNAKLKKSLDLLRKEQNAGRKIQFKLLPPQNFEYDRFKFSRIILPSLYLSGDFVDYKVISEDYIVFFLADISGHGVASSFVTVLLKNIFEHYYKRFKRDNVNLLIKPDKFLSVLNKEIYDLKLEKYLVIFYGVIDIKNNNLIYENAGQDPYPILFDGNEYQKLYTGNLPVGLFEFSKYENHQIKLPEEFVLLTCSDGILEIMEENKIEKQEDRLLDSIKNVDMKIEDFIKYFDLKGRENLPDDITFLLINGKKLSDGE